MIYEPSRPEVGTTLDIHAQMSFAEDSHVRTSPMLDQKLVLLGREVDSGLRCGDLLGSYDQASSSWRTSKPCLFAESKPFLEIWPASGMTRNGTVYERRPLVRLITAPESLLLRTPNRTDSHFSPVTLRGASGRRIVESGKSAESG